MSTADALFRFLGPLAALPVVGILALLLRWAYGRRGSSLVERRPVVGGTGEYGLLVAVSTPGSIVEAELHRCLLEDAGIRATLVTTADGPRIMVFREHERIARALLAS